MEKYSITEATKIIAAHVEVPRLVQEVPEGPWQDYFTAQLGIRMSDIVEAHAVNGLIVSDEIDAITAEVQEMFEQELSRAKGVTFGK